MHGKSIVVRGIKTVPKRLVHTTVTARQQQAGSKASDSAIDSADNAGQKEAGRLLDIDRQPFPRLPITNTGVTQLLPRTQVLKKVFLSSNYSITQSQLMELAVQFTKINSSSASVAEPMEEWRQRVLNMFDGHLRDITRVAGVLVKLSENKALAFAMYKVAGEEGYENALHYYAMMLGTQSVSQKNGRIQSHGIIRRLAEAGHGPSQMVLADVLLAKNDAGLAQKAIGLLEKAAAAGLPAAVYKLGDVYRKGQGALASNPERALDWYAKAADMGVGQAHFAMGNMYSQGQGTLDGQPDFTLALRCFETAALLDIKEAQYNVGLYYLEGRGVQKNANLAVEYWLMAAANRFPVAALNLGKLFAEGKEVEKNYRRARDMLAIAIECSDPQKIIERSARDVLQKMETEQEAKKGWCTIM
ncbi:hypothetical protein H4R99_003173 [Coemansia sp. RSA 1722]|nr:hypothetical protein H4R99_003173 [Coemansia sp. RSA 1722]